MSSTDWVERVTSLNQWRRGGERAPHKPLLLLYALGRLQRTGSSRMAFAEAEGDLRRLLEEFGPPRSTSPGYPFHHLTTDGLWVVGTPAGAGSPGPNLGELRAGAIGELAADFAGDLEHDSRLFGSVVRAILDANFPATMHQDILDATGIALASEELAETTVRPKGQRRRDPAFRELVLRAYEYRCAVCGYDGQLLRESVGIDAAHVRWWAAAGPDEVANGIALCSLHHKLFDRGAIGLTADHGVAVSSHFLGRSPAAEALVLSLVGKPLLSPQAGQPRPHATHVAWHSREVFRTPARQEAE
jgi:putative restriction endonuclease